MLILITLKIHFYPIITFTSLCIINSLANLILQTVSWFNENSHNKKRWVITPHQQRKFCPLPWEKGRPPLMPLQRTHNALIKGLSVRITNKCTPPEIKKEDNYSNIFCCNNNFDLILILYRQYWWWVNFYLPKKVEFAHQCSCQTYHLQTKF